MQVSRETVEALRGAQAEWASQFSAYPGEDAQMKFQAGWLLKNGHPEKVICPDGLTWGAE